MKKKLHLGKPTLRSIEIQILAILQTLYRGKLEISKITPKRTNTGIFLWVKFNTNEPADPQSRIFAMQRVGECCDVWLETPASPHFKTSNNDAA